MNWITSRLPTLGRYQYQPFLQAHREHPEIALVGGSLEQNIGGGWHTDHSFDEVLRSILAARELPPEGVYVFVSAADAFDRLDPAKKRTHEANRNALREARIW